VRARFSAHVQTGSGPTQPPIQWVPLFYRGKVAGACWPPTLSSAEVIKTTAKILLSHWVFLACSRENFNFTFYLAYNIKSPDTLYLVILKIDYSHSEQIRRFISLFHAPVAVHSLKRKI